MYKETGGLRRDVANPTSPSESNSAVDEENQPERPLRKSARRLTKSGRTPGKSHLLGR